MTNSTTDLAPGSLVMRTLWGELLSCQTVECLGVKTDILLQQMENIVVHLSTTLSKEVSWQNQRVKKTLLTTVRLCEYR